MAKDKNQRKHENKMLAAAAPAAVPRAALLPDKQSAVALLDEFVANTDYELNIVWPDASLLTCVYLRVNAIVLDHDHLLRGSHRYALPPPYKGMYVVEWGVTPEVPIKGTLVVGIVNLRASTKLVVDFVDNPGRKEWTGDKVVNAP